MTLLMALTMCAAIHAQEIQKLDKFPSGYINGVFMGEAKFKTVDGVLYAVGYEGTRDWILVRYPAGSRNESYTVHPYCRRIARGAFQGAAYLKEIRIFSNGKADIIMEDVGGSAYYAETYKWHYDGNFLSFTRGNTTYQFQITGYLSPELYLRDSRGKYTWAWRRSEECIK